MNKMAQNDHYSQILLLTEEFQDRPFIMHGIHKDRIKTAFLSRYPTLTPLETLAYDGYPN
jgi:hypothetical protein